MKKKKVLAILMAGAMLVSCAKAPEETAEETTKETTVATTTAEETTEETTAAPTATPTPRPTATPTPVPSPTPVPEPVLIENVPITEYVDATTIGVGYGATYPTLKFETEDAARINAEVLALAEEIDEYDAVALNFQIIQNTDTVFTLLVVRSGESDFHEYHPYVIDSSNGTQLSNEEIMSLAGVDPSSLHDRAVTSIQDAFNEMFTASENSFTGGNPMYVNGEVCDDGWPEGRTADYFTDQDCYESTFSEETLNPDMPMFLDADLNLILTSTVFTTGGSSAVNVVYNLEGSFLGSYGSSHEIPYDYQLTFYQETMYLTIRDRSTDTCTDLIYEDGEFVEA